MSKQEQIEIAKWCIDKGYDFEQLDYSDNMYGKTEFTEDVWEYVVECQEIGTIAFNEKYK